MRWSREQFRQWWLFSRMADWAPAVIALAIFGLVRVGITAAVVYRGGWPMSALGWSGAISSLAAAGQAVAVAVLLPAVRQYRPVLAGMIAAAGIGTAVVDAALWVVLGSSAGAAGYAWQLVLAVVFAVAAMVLCRSGIDSIWTASGYDLPRIARVMRWSGGMSIAAAATGEAAVLVVEQPAADRLLRLIAVASLASAVIATVVVIGVALEQVRTKRKARVAELYRRISSDGSSNDR
jgi:hypothetical protein